MFKLLSEAIFQLFLKYIKNVEVRSSGFLQRSIHLEPRLRSWYFKLFFISCKPNPRACTETAFAKSECKFPSMAQWWLPADSTQMQTPGNLRYFFCNQSVIARCRVLGWHLGPDVLKLSSTIWGLDTKTIHSWTNFFVVCVGFWVGVGGWISPSPNLSQNSFLLLTFYYYCLFFFSLFHFLQYS